MCEHVTQTNSKGKPHSRGEVKVSELDAIDGRMIMITKNKGVTE